MNRLNPSAIVDPRAELDRDVEVGPYCVIGAGVRVGKGTKLHSHVSIQGRTTLGENNVIFPFASVGSAPQDLKYKGEPSQLLIGNGNTIREYVSLNPGTSGGGMVTRVGDQNLLMMYCHIAHDCIVGNRNVIANGATLGGHVIVEDHVIVGGLVGIHQFVRVGEGSMIGGNASISRDVPPFTLAAGRNQVYGLNLVGLRRRQTSKLEISDLKQCYRAIFSRSGDPRSSAEATLRSGHCGGSGHGRRLLEFFAEGLRGFARPALSHALRKTATSHESP